MQVYQFKKEFFKDQVIQFEIISLSEQSILIIIQNTDSKITSLSVGMKFPESEKTSTSLIPFGLKMDDFEQGLSERLALRISKDQNKPTQIFVSYNIESLQSLELIDLQIFVEETLLKYFLEKGIIKGKSNSNENSNENLNENLK
ncbi:proteasome assembly chaperone 4 [Anaeramoeba ignava]|uniref:Proteasome assembly chaperone 4 n=1 Tax=Anaeramoeba ignava TaxID=1746090 RepID=A0A9Q0REC4_ANAIG|nr:proteasome assembly chaperone 4 [Anaeramoeba ignava]